MGQAGVGKKLVAAWLLWGWEFPNSFFSRRKRLGGSEGQVDGELVCRGSPGPRCLRPAPLLPAASPTLGFSVQQLLEAAFRCAGSVSPGKSFAWLRNISFYRIFLLGYFAAAFWKQFQP